MVTADAMLTNHRMVRDGSVWYCVHCRATVPFPSPYPTPVAPCVPRRWGDDRAEPCNAERWLMTGGAIHCELGAGHAGDHERGAERWVR